MYRRPRQLLARFALVAFVATAAIGASGAVSVAQTEGSLVFECTGAPETVTVPDGTTHVIVEAYGGAGGNIVAGENESNSGGAGGGVIATVPVTPGETLDVRVGCVGGDVVGFEGFLPPGPGGYGGAPGGNGGLEDYDCGYGAAGGGGSSELLRGGERLVVAGGGGGAGATWEPGFGTGGAGGGAAGGAGVQSKDYDNIAGGGAGGTATTGGAGGAAGGAENTFPGEPGTATSGGAGGEGHCGGGGGGGGGWFGGGGGGGGDGGGGGGGGSAYAAAGATGVEFGAGVNAGDGVLALTFTTIEADDVVAPAPVAASPRFTG